MIILNEKQEKGLDIAVNRFLNKNKYVVISGYAGSGKSTLVKFITQAIIHLGEDVNEDDICYCAYTGKATQVLFNKGNKNVSTLHKLLYESIPRPDGSFFRRVKKHIDYKIIIVDECSMVPKDMIELLNKFNIFVIYLGDPFQIPPINPEEGDGNSLLKNPHIFLDEIMRQEAESDIIQLSMKIRNNEPISYNKGKDSMVIPKAELNTGILKWADIVICATNATRIQLNNQMRTLEGRTGDPCEGDKVICTRNYWTHFSSDGDPLINGAIGTISNTYDDWAYTPNFAGGKRINYLRANFTLDEGGVYKDLQIDKNMIATGEPTLNRKIQYRLGFKYKHLIPFEFEYGYAITGHKSQGSQWGKVVVIEEKFPYNQIEHARWLYTSITRSIDKLVLVR